MSQTLIPYRHVPALLAGPARLPMIELRDTASTTCTDPRGGDREGRVCLCHWAPWFADRGRPQDGLDEDYEPPRPGDPLAGLPGADPWRPPQRLPRRHRGRPDPGPAPLRHRENRS